MAEGSKELSKNRVIVTLYKGENPLTGTPIYGSQSFSNVNEQLNPVQIIEVMEALFGLQEHMLSGFEQQETYDLRYS